MVRRLLGPLHPTSVQRQRLRLRERISALELAGKPDYVWWHPSADPQLVLDTYASLETQLSLWCSNETLDAVDFQNMMFSVLCPDDHGPDHDMKLARIYIQWIEQRLYDCWPEDLDPDRAVLLEQAYMDMLEDMPTWQMRCEMSRLAQQWHHLPPDYSTFPNPDPPRQLRSYNRSHAIQSHFADLPTYEANLLRWRFLNRPAPNLPQHGGPVYVVHLYSGRRRAEDFHHWMTHYLAQHADQ